MSDQLPETVEQLQERRRVLLTRLDDLEPTFVKIQNELFRHLNREVVKGMLFFIFDHGANLRTVSAIGRARLYSFETLERRLSSIWRDMQQDEPQIVMLMDDGLVLWGRLYNTLRTTLEPLRKWVHSERQEQLARQRLTAAKCPAISDVVTVLTDYFWLPGNEYQPAQLYENIARIITEIAQPACPICGRPHNYSKGKAVRQRDRHKGHRWEDRRQERVRALKDLLPQEGASLTPPALTRLLRLLAAPPQANASMTPQNLVRGRKRGDSLKFREIKAMTTNAFVRALALKLKDEEFQYKLSLFLPAKSFAQAYKGARATT